MRTAVMALALTARLALAASATIPLDVTLDLSDVSIGTWMGADVFAIPGGVVPFAEGEPALPGIPCTVLLPQGSSISGVTVEVLSEAALPGTFRPASVTCLPIGASWLADPGSVPVALTDDAIPASPVGETVSGSLTGYRVGSFVLVPFRYHPLSGTVSVITSARISVVCAPDPSVPLLDLDARQVALAASGLEPLVRNPGMLAEWAPASTDRGVRGPVWVAIADGSLEAVLQPLVDHRNEATGPSAFVPLESICADYPGDDTQERIRNYLKDAFENEGLVYALIVGDYGETTRISSLKVGENTLNNVSDLYYADLDGTWDGDGDHLYGERSDALELLGDIYVGRFSSDVPNLIANMVERTVAYETTAPEGAWRTTALLLGAGLWPDTHYWGSFVCDSIAERIPSGWTVEKRYETEEGHPNDQIATINAGTSYVSVQGHGWAGGVAWYDFAPTDIISNSNYTQLTNIDMLPIFHSMACMSGELTNAGCIAERLMMAPWGGAAGVMFNSSYGWGTPPSTGPSEWLEIRFAEQLFVYGRNEVGVAQGFAKDAIYFQPGVPLIDWVMQENNLLGDPALVFAAGQTGIGSPSSPPLPTLGISSSPNPAAGPCTVSWTAPGDRSPRVEVYDLAGRCVAVIADGSQAPGDGSVRWDAAGPGGCGLPSGCYALVARTDGTVASSRLMLLNR